MFQVTRRRLALWYTGVTAILLLCFASGFYLYVRSTLIERIDDTLNHVIEVVERSLVIEPLRTPPLSSPAVLGGLFQVNIEASFPDNHISLEDDHIDLEWFSPTGELLWSTFIEPLKIPLHTNRLGETVRVENTHNNPSLTSLPLVLRQVTDRVEKGRQTIGYLRVSHPWFEVSKPIRQLIFDLILGTFIILIGVSGIGWLLSGLAMKPITESYQRLKQFTADASHELRSPIATIQTNVQVALAEPDLDSQQAQHLQVIERLTRRLGRLVDDLLFLARQDSGIIQSKKTEIPLDALLMDVVEEQKIIATSQGIPFTLDIADLSTDLTLEEPPPEEHFNLQGDWDELARLFTNLVSNGIQYTTSGGQVHVDLKKITKYKLNPGVFLSVLQVKIKDTGRGIPEELISQVFERFYRVDPARTHQTVPGSGLGLAIAKAIVERHQGQISLESQVNQGTIFTVTLPIHPF